MALKTLFASSLGRSAVRSLGGSGIASFNGSFRSFSLNSSLFNISEIKNLPELNSILKDNKENLTFVDFYATWCGPCKAISPLLEELSKSYKEDKVQFYKVDVDSSQDLTMEFGVSHMPTFILFKNNEAIGKITGANPKAIKSAIEKYK